MTLLDEAIIFAVNQHSGMCRKFSDTPYIMHPMEVCAIISTMTNNRETMIAGLLHDTIEDCCTDENLILEKFGERVLFLVKSETEDKMRHMEASLSWQKRKEDSLIVLRDTDDLDIKILWLADKLSNMRSFYREFLKSGNSIWDRTHEKNPEKQYWYYKTIADYTKELSGQPAYEEYVNLLNTIFNKGDEKDGNN